MNNTVIFTNGPFQRPFCECVQLFIEKEKDYKWAITVGGDCVLSFDKEKQTYDTHPDRLVLTNDNPVWKNKTISYWDSQEEAMNALKSALKQNKDLFWCDFLFWSDNHPNVSMRNKLLME